MLSSSKSSARRGRYLTWGLIIWWSRAHWHWIAQTKTGKWTEMQRALFFSLTWLSGGKHWTCGWSCRPQHKVPSLGGLRVRWCSPEWDKGHDQSTSKVGFFMKTRQGWKTRKCDPVKKRIRTTWHYAGNRDCQQNTPCSDCRNSSEDKLTKRLVHTSWLDLFLSPFWPSFFLSTLPRTTKDRRQVSGWHWFFSFNLWGTVKNNQ